MAQEPETADDRAVAEIIANIKSLAHRINAEFVPDPEKVRTFTAGYAQSRERARAAVEQMKNRTGG